MIHFLCNEGCDIHFLFITCNFVIHMKIMSENWGLGKTTAPNWCSKLAKFYIVLWLTFCEHKNFVLQFSGRQFFADFLKCIFWRLKIKRPLWWDVHCLYKNTIMEAKKKPPSEFSQNLIHYGELEPRCYFLQIF